MFKHKVLSAVDNEHFIKTGSFHQLCQVLKDLKKSKGHFVLVLGTPGTGKSANIYQALSFLDLDVYDAFLFIDMDSEPSDVFETFWKTIEKDMDVTSREDLYENASQYDLILFADKFLDSEYIDKDKVGLGLWTEEHGPSTAPFYFRVFYEYLKHHGDLKKVNVLAQTSWVFKFKGIRYDILTDFSFLSRFLVFLLKQLFEVVLISYTREETIKIVKSHYNLGDDDINKLIDTYGNRPRFIFEALEKEDKI